MALINCPECGKEVSDRAQKCIHCGYPLSQNTDTPPVSAPATSAVNEIQNKSVGVIKKIGVKKIIIIAVAITVVISAIIGIVAALALADDVQSIKADEIELGKTYTVKNIGEIEILRVSTTKHLLNDDGADKNHIVFECYFKNTTNELYPISKLATISAKSKETGAVYSTCEVGKPGNSVVSNLDAEPNLKTKVWFAVEIPEDESDVVVTLDFNEEYKLNFKYTVGDLIRNHTEINEGDTMEVEGTASVDITEIVYSEGLWAPKAYSGRTHNGISVDDPDKSAYLIIDTMYTNLKHINQAPDDIVSVEVIYENKYYYLSKLFCSFYNRDKYINTYVSDSNYIPNVEERACIVIEVPMDMIDKEVEINIFIGDKEFTYVGTPEYDNKYGMDYYY